MTGTGLALPRYLPRQNLLLDSNLLLLFIIGSYDIELIAAFKRVAGYSSRDYDILERLARGFRNLLATPHILTEVGNLANSLPERIKGAWAGHFASRIARMEERHIPAIELAGRPEFTIFGITDSALASMAETTLVVTADDRLCSHLQRSGLLAISFNQMRVNYLPQA